MAGEIEIGGGDTGDSPWAGDQPVAPAPSEFRWSADRSVSAEPPDGDRDAPPAEPTDGSPRQPPADGGSFAGFDRADHEDRIDPSPVSAVRSRRRLAVGGTVAVLAIIVGVLAVVRDDPGADDLAADDASSATPSTGADDPAADDGSLPTVDPPATDAVPTTSVRPVGQAGGSASDGGDVIDATSWGEDSIELPARLRRVSQPTTIVATTYGGTFFELEIPAGRVSSIELPSSVLNAQLSVGATTALLASYSGTRAKSWLLAVGETPIQLELPGERNEMVAIPTTDEYVGWFYGGLDGGDEFQQVHVFADGSTELRTIGDGAPPWQRAYSPTGDLLVSDAGGVYRIDADGAATRISTGTLVASSARHLLVRQCDEDYVCGHELIDASTGERRTVTIERAHDPLFGNGQVQVSPDGRFVRSVEFTDNQSREYLLDLDTGEESSSVTFAFDGLADIWANDSSGVFRSNGSRGLQFVDRATGEVTVFGEELGQIRSFSVRRAAVDGAIEQVPPITSGLSIVGLGIDGGVIRIDIDSGEYVETLAPPLASGAPAYVFVDADGATIASYDNVPSMRFDAATGATRLTPQMGPTGPMTPGPLAGTAWQRRQLERATDSLVVDLVDSLGNELGQQIEVGPSSDAELLGSDGTGGLLVRSELGGVFSLAADRAPQRVSSGEVIAIGPTVAYVRECDASFVCGVFRLDRIAGGRTLVDVPALELAGSDDAAGGPFGQSVSPDGDVALVRVSGFGTEWTMVDIAGATSVPVPGVAVASPVAWSADSQWALYLSGDVLRLYDRAAGGLRTLSNLPKLKAFGVDP